MPRASKPVAVIKEEKRGHRTKAELNMREKAEEDLLSGKPLFEREEVKKDKIAHKEFKRIKQLMTAIKKNDALYAPALNRYCMLFSEERMLKMMYDKLNTLLTGLEEQFENIKGDLNYKETKDLIKQLASFTRQVSTLDGLIMQKRTAQGKIESDNCMNVAAALRTIPKEVGKEEKDELLKVLNGE